MRKIRFLIMMAAMLLSCGIANAQGTDATDGQTTTLKGDLNEDGRVNAADVTVLVGIIMETDYFLLSNDAAVPNKGNYTSFDGVVTNYKSIDDVLGKDQTISLTANQKGILLCPNDWEVKDLVLQNEAGTIYAFGTPQEDIPGYALFQTGAVAAAGTYTLKTKADAEAYVISITDFFYLGLDIPTKDNYTTIDGVATNYKSIKEVLDAELELELLSGGEQGFLLCPDKSDWKVEDLVLQNKNTGSYIEFKAATTDINGYALYKTEDIENDGTYVLKTEAAAEAYVNKLKEPQYFGQIGRAHV